MPGPTELAIILIIVLILFGAGKLPQVFEAFGDGIKKFRDAQKDEPKDVSPPKELASNGVAAAKVREAEEVHSE